MKPGSVNSVDRAPPPTVSRASKTQTDQPARAISMAAARPFGPEPTTTASKSIALFYMPRPQFLRQPQSLRQQTKGGGLWPKPACCDSGHGRQTAHARRNRPEQASTNCSDVCDHPVVPLVERHIHASRDTGRGIREKTYWR